MATYRIKRRLYSLADAAGNTIGGVASGVGKALDSTPAALAGGVHGFMGPVGSTLGTALSGVIPGGSILGRVAGAAIESSAVRGLGKGLKSAGDSLQS